MGRPSSRCLSEKLGIDADLIRYRYGDSDLVTMGIGTFGSRSAQLAGSAIVVAADRLIDKGRKIAAHMMEAGAHDIEFDGRQIHDCRHRPVGRHRRGRQAVFRRRASAERHRGRLLGARQFRPARLRDLPQRARIVCEVEIDEETGEVALTRYVAVDDVGRVLNPLLCEGQIHGGIVQGAGQALMEDLVYDPSSGQLLTGSFQDYAMPRADDFCRFELANNPTLTDRNPLGVKGVGEAGTLCAIPAVMNAVNDALARIGAPRVEGPAISEKVWRALRAAR